MKRIILLLIITCSALSIQAQFYTTSSQTGSYYQPGFFPWYFDTTVVEIIPRFFNFGSNDSLSPPQPLPFSFDFYGQAYTSYRVSDNGYLSFDANPDTSGVPIALPDPSGPNNAIYAFWLDWWIGYNSPPGAVLSWNSGEAPNRIHYVKWQGALPYPWANGIHDFILRLHECGDFDVNLVRGMANPATIGTIGCENASGTQATTVAGSPGYPYPTGNEGNPQDDILWTFKPAHAQNDLGIQEVSPNNVVQGKTETIGITVINTGAQPIQSFDAHWEANGGNSFSTTITGLNLAPNDTYSFNHSVVWNVIPHISRKQELHVWLDNVNGTTDDRTCNNHFRDSLNHSLGDTVTRYTLVEDFAATYCGLCPAHRNAIYNEAGNYIRIAVHINDGLSINSPLENLAWALPSAGIDRRCWPLTCTGVNGSNLRPFMRVAEATPAYARVGVYGTYDSQSRQLEADLLTKIVNYLDIKEHRLSLLIVEDSITGYPQINTGGGPNPINDYVHKFVLRDHPSGAWGLPGIVPDAVLPGEMYAAHISYTLPATWNEDQIYLVGVLTEHDTSIADRPVLNAFMVKMSDIMLSRESAVETSEWEVFPIPTTDKVTVQGNLKRKGEVNLQLFDLTGKVIKKWKVDQVSPGSYSRELDVGGLPGGLYFLQIQGDGRQFMRKIWVER